MREEKAYFSIRKKFLFLIIAMMLLSSICIVLVLRLVLYQNYVVLEHEGAKTDHRRVEKKIANELKQLGSICEDWAFWDDTYNFVKTKNPLFIEVNLNSKVFETDLFDLICILDMNAQILFLNSSTQNTGDKNTISLSQNIAAFKKSGLNEFISLLEVGENSINGMIQTDYGLKMLSVKPILTSEKEGPSQGYLILFKSLDEEYLSQIIQEIEVDFQLISLSNKIGWQENKDVINHIELSDDKMILTESLKYITAVSLASDIYGSPAFLLKTTTQGYLTEQGGKVLWASLLIICSALLLVIFFLWFLIRYVIINPILHLQKQVLAIKNNVYTDDMVFESRDELSLLSHEIDQMEKIISAKNTELLTINKQLEQMSITDGLTNLFNRRHLDERLRVEWERAHRTAETISVILCDIDYFKKYNDIYGHQAGDICLQKVASVLKNGVHRISDEAFRYGGEEFILLLPNTDSAGAIHVARDILASVYNQKIEHAGSFEYLCVSISIGVSSLVPRSGNAAPDLVAQSDAALYESKKNGRNRITVCDSTGDSGFTFHEYTL